MVDYKSLFYIENTGTWAYKLYYENGVYAGELVLNEGFEFDWWPAGFSGAYSYKHLMGIAQWSKELEKAYEKENK